MVEFFSGIGGMRLGVEAAFDVLKKNGSTALEAPCIASCTAYEISLFANAAYKHNFPETPSHSVKTKLVEQLKPVHLDGKADLWTMSPPCQPFSKTLLAKQRDKRDKRSAGFIALMNMLEKLDSPPKWILLENVKNFFGSEAYNDWCGKLAARGYTWKGFLLTPMQFGVPNNRMRYYQLCELSDRWRGCSASEAPATIIERLGNVQDVQPLSDFVAPSMSDEEAAKYLLSRETLSKKWASDVSVVSKHDKVTYCFTAAYARIIHRASGSLLHMHADRPFEGDPLDKTDMTKYHGSIRKFSPRELLALFGFPSSFTLPNDMKLEKKYKLIGNSVNVRVVRNVVAELLSK